MPVIEFFGSVVMVALLVALLLIVGAFFAAAGTGIVLFCLCTGWLPILMCATDPHMNIGDGFVGTWALLSLVIYTIASFAVLTVMFVKPDPDGLPPAWKFLAMFYRYETVQTVRSASETVTASFDGKRFAEAVKDAPTSVYRSMIETRAIRKETERTNANADRLRASVELSEAALEMERLKARQQELQEIINRKKRT